MGNVQKVNFKQYLLIKELSQFNEDFVINYDENSNTECILEQNIYFTFIMI